MLERFEFFDNTAGSHLGWIEGNTVNGVKQPNLGILNAAKFSETMYQAAEAWDASIANNAALQLEKAKLLVIRSRGITLSGVHFG